MRFITRVLPLLSLAAFSACGVGGTTDCCVDLSTPSLRVINAFTTPVDVLIDGNLAISALAAGSVGKTATSSGNHTLMLRPSAGASMSQSITTTTGALSTIAAVRTSSGSVSTAILDDTNSVVPAGATKLRVLHLAPNAGELQVYRTQPDYQTPISWQFPFTYQASPNSLSAPFYQSTVGSWEVRIWQTPAGASGWATAPVKVVVPLGSGERKTIVILDQPGGGVKVEVL
jgi:hypothetical protein